MFDSNYKYLFRVKLEAEITKSKTPNVYPAGWQEIIKIITMAKFFHGHK